jgi:hypothetical protein
MSVYSCVRPESKVPNVGRWGWKRGLVTAGSFLVGATMTLSSCQSTPPEIHGGNQIESPRTAGEYKEFSIEKINREGIDSDYFDLRTLAYIYHTFESAKEEYYQTLTPEERIKKNWKVTGLDDLNGILKKEAPYISKELKPTMNGNDINFPTIKPDYRHSVANYNTGIASPLAAYVSKDNHTEVDMLKMDNFQCASPVIAHETFHAQAIPRSLIERLGWCTNKYGFHLYHTVRQQKFFNDGLATMFQNEVCADIALDSDHLMSNYLSSVIASNIRDIACENAIKTDKLPEFESYFNSGTEMGYKDINSWTKYNRPATLAYLKSIQEGEPIVVDGILIDGLYNFWEAAKKMNDDELEGKLFVKKEGLLVPVYDGFAHGYLNGNRFVPLSIPSEVAYEKHWINEKYP